MFGNVTTEIIKVGIDECTPVYVPQETPSEAGFFIAPHIFAVEDHEERLAQEEIFGPVLILLKARNLEHAFTLANSTNYGLAAGVWTESLRRAVEMSNRLVAGTVWVNTYRSTSYTTPFGGYKASGLGRENGIETLKAYTRNKSIQVELISRRSRPQS